MVGSYKKRQLDQVDSTYIYLMGWATRSLQPVCYGISRSTTPESLEVYRVIFPLGEVKEIKILMKCMFTYGRDFLKCVSYGSYWRFSSTHNIMLPTVENA